MIFKPPSDDNLYISSMKLDLIEGLRNIQHRGVADVVSLEVVDYGFCQSERL